MADAGIVSIDVRKRALGVGLVVLSTIAIAIVPSLAKLAYEGGSNTLSVITGRSIFSVLITFVLLLVSRQPLAIPRRPMLIALGMGVAYAVMLYGYLGAVNYLPVSLVILIYFIHPVLVGFIVVVLGQEKLTIISIGALVAALVGLYLAVGLSFEKLSGIGLALAVLAMAVTAIIVVCGSRATAEAKAISIGFYMMLSAAAALTVIFALWNPGLAHDDARLDWLCRRRHRLHDRNARVYFRYGLRRRVAGRNDQQPGAGAWRPFRHSCARRECLAPSRHRHRGRHCSDFCDGDTALVAASEW
ncbi:DMT family transporter [Mesorhizobium atlanticum]